MLMRLRGLVLSAVTLSMACLGASPAAAAVYANITEVTAEELTNGVQITVKADGVLKWQGRSQGRDSRISLRFPGVRSRVGASFVDVSKFPVSGVLLAVPQDAAEGVGIDMTITLFASSAYNITEATNQQSVLITVNSDRTIEKGKAGGKEGGGAAETSLDVRFQEGLLSVRAVRTDIHTLLSRIAEAAGVDIAVDDAVTRTASLNLEGLPVDAVLRAIASAYGLALSQVNDVYMISKGVPDDLAAYRLSGTESFRMKYIQADTASGLLPYFLFQYLHRNSEQNAIVVTAPTQMLDKIRSDLRKVDVAPPMILVEALAVEVNSTSDLEAALGVRLSDASLQPPAADGTVAPATGLRTDSATGDLSYRNIGNLPRNFSAALRALETAGKARIHANPRMAALNGRPAELFIGSQKFIQVLYNQWGSQQTRIRAVDVGVKLEVTPWTGGNGEITTRIEPEVSNIIELDPVSSLPVLSTRRAQTSVRVKDGETIVIGGLRQKQATVVRRKVPVLGDIPLIGSVFRSKMVNHLDTELVIFITPRILTETGHLPDAESEEAIRERLQK